MVSSPDSLLDLSLPGQLKITTLNNGATQETLGFGRLVTLQLSTIFNDSSRFLHIVNTSANFDAVEVSQGAALGALNSLDVHAPLRCHDAR